MKRGASEFNASPRAQFRKVNANVFFVMLLILSVNGSKTKVSFVEKFLNSPSAGWAFEPGSPSPGLNSTAPHPSSANRDEKGRRRGQTKDVAAHDFRTSVSPTKSTTSAPPPSSTTTIFRPRYFRGLGDKSVDDEAKKLSTADRNRGVKGSYAENRPSSQKTQEITLKKGVMKGTGRRLQSSAEKLQDGNNPQTGRRHPGFTGSKTRLKKKFAETGRISKSGHRKGSKLDYPKKTSAPPVSVPAKHKSNLTSFINHEFDLKTQFHPAATGNKRKLPHTLPANFLPGKLASASTQHPRPSESPVGFNSAKKAVHSSWSEKGNRNTHSQVPSSKKIRKLNDSRKKPHDTGNVYVNGAGSSDEDAGSSSAAGAAAAGGAVYDQYDDYGDEEFAAEDVDDDVIPDFMNPLFHSLLSGNLSKMGSMAIEAAIYGYSGLKSQMDALEAYSMEDDLGGLVVFFDKEAFEKEILEDSPPPRRPPTNPGAGNKNSKPQGLHQVPSPSLGPGSTKSTLTSKPATSVSAGAETGGDKETPPSQQQPIIEKRNLVQFARIITVYNSVSPIYFIFYGNWCGPLGNGPAADGIDQCCKVHDYCYGDVMYDVCPRGWRNPYTVIYDWKIARGPRGGKRAVCMPGDPCGRQTCLCDQRAAKCFGKNVFNRRHVGQRLFG